MERENREGGFTLIELILVIAIIGIVYTSLYNVNLLSWQFWNINRDRVELKQQVKVILTSLENDIRRAVDVKVENVGSDEYGNILLMNLGDTDEDGIDYFIKYIVENNTLYKYKTVESFTGPDSSDWPALDQWGSGRVLTQDIVTDCKFKYDYVDDFVYFIIDLENDTETYRLENNIHSRVYQ